MAAGRVEARDTASPRHEADGPAAPALLDPHGPRARPRGRRPLASASLLARPRLERELTEGAAQRRLTLVVAGAGFGKTTLLSRLAEHGRTGWYTIDPRDRDSAALAAGIAEAFHEALPGFASDVDELARGPVPTSELEARERAVGTAHRLVDALERSIAATQHRPGPDAALLIIDDAQGLEDDAPAWSLIETLVRVAPPEVHFLIGSRTEPRLALERMRGQGEVLDIGGADLAFDQDEIEAVLGRALAAEPPDEGALRAIAAQILDVTAGWPAAVRLAAEALRAARPAGREHALGRLRAPDGPLFAYLAEEVIAVATEPVRDLLRRMAAFDRFSVPLCEALGVVNAERTLAGLARRALFLQPISGERDWYELHGLVRDYVQRQLPLPPEELAELHRRAAAWFAGEGMPAAALRSLVSAGDGDALAAFLRASGGELVARGSGRDVVAAIRSLPSAVRDGELDLLLGEAGVAIGDFVTAVAALRRAAGDSSALPAAVAWRLGLIDGLRGAYDEALAVYGRADLAGATAEDEAFLHAFTASAHRHRGEAAATLESGRLALAAAIRSEQPRAIAAASMAVGQGRELANELPAALDAYERALVAAEEAGDAVQRVRILTAIGQLCLDMGRFERANASLDEAVVLGAAIGFASFHARALAERGRARSWLGRMEEGLEDAGAARELYARLDSPGRVFALLDEGELHLYRGDRNAARPLLESAVLAARESSDLLLGACLAELAETVVDEDPARASDLVAEAAALARRYQHPQTMTTTAYTYLAMGEREQARAMARQVELLAGRSGAIPQVAHAREILARLADDRSEARRLFDSALHIWQELGAPLGAALNRFWFAHVATGPEARAAAEEARHALHAFGARIWAAEAAAIVTDLDRSERPAVAILTLGGFAVLRSGHAVPSSEWRSKKARDLLKILAARRGRPSPREQLYELLWPDEDPEPLANRLSVALATVRTVLDPERRHPSDHFVGADRSSVWLDLDHVDLDLARFVEGVAAARRLRRSGREAEALAAFELVEAEYRGEFLEEDPYEEFAIGPREEAQAAYMDAAREVARHAIARHDPDTAIRIQLRILEIDPFDERAHTGLIGALIAAGRHGEARRRYGVFVARMSEIGMDAGSFPMTALGGQAG